MSSFIGHTLAGLTTYATTQQIQINGAKGSEPFKLNHLKWFFWLLVIASIPDIDYLIPALRLQQANQVLRITHSFIGVLLIPVCTILGLCLTGKYDKNFKRKCLQVVLVGLSHLLLDLSTGVFPLPLLYPFSLQTFRLPFGVLPSAGRIQLNNSLLYRNLLIELGVLLPLSASLFLSVQGFTRSGRQRLIIVGGLIVSGCFMVWASTLGR
jgi:inner membrane protein